MGNHYRIRFQKVDKMKFIGHLDLMKIFQRAVKRARLPVAYSQGFNPHQLISIAAPLPIGVESIGESMDIVLEEERDEQSILKGLNEELPDGLQVLVVKKMGEKEKNGASLTVAAEYEITMSDNAIAEDVVNNLMSQHTVLMKKKTKSGVKESDIREDIKQCQMQEGKLFVVLSAGSIRNLKPDLLVECLYQRSGFAQGNVKYLRKALLKEANGRMEPL